MVTLVKNIEKSREEAESPQISAFEFDGVVSGWYSVLSAQT